MSAVVPDGRAATYPAVQDSVSVPFIRVPIARRSGHVRVKPGLIEGVERALSDPGRAEGESERLPPAGPRPAGWSSGPDRDPRRRMAKARQGRLWRPDRQCIRFAGDVVVAPNYMLSAPGRPSWPVNLDDVRSVVAWVRTNADALGINVNEVAAIGESARADLAALLGTDPGPPEGGVSTQVEAVIAFSTPTNLSVLGGESPYAGLAASQFLGGSPRRCPPVMRRRPP